MYCVGHVESVTIPSRQLGNSLWPGAMRCTTWVAADVVAVYGRAEIMQTHGGPGNQAGVAHQRASCRTKQEDIAGLHLPTPP